VSFAQLSLTGSPFSRKKSDRLADVSDRGIRLRDHHHRQHRSRRGDRTALIDAVKERAKAKGCKRLWLITTNDNLNALGFYQRRGFRLIALYPNALEASRKLKPQIPMKAANGIPIRDELELELELLIKKIVY
jgi:hypothetical protein